MYFRPSQWTTFVLARLVTELRNVIPAISQWTWYAFRRALLAVAAKYAIETFWLCFKKRKLGVTYARELSLMQWVPSNFYYDMDMEMRVFIRKCGYHYPPEGVGLGTKVQPWFYGDIKDDTREILAKMEAKAVKAFEQEASSAEELQTISRILRNFKQFTIDEIMMFFKKSELMTMELGDTIFGYEDTQEYFYGVQSGEIHLFAEGIGGRDIDLIKVANSEDCIVSLQTFLYRISIGPQTYGDLKLHAKCGAPGKYYRIQIADIIKYAMEDKHYMTEILSNVLIRSYKFNLGFNDLTGIMPRMHRQDYLEGSYDPIDLEPGILTDNRNTWEAFTGLSKVFNISNEDRKLCWVGVLDSRTILLRRYKPTQYAFYIHKGLLACTVSKLRRSYNAIQFYLSGGQVVGWREAVTGMDMAVQYQVADGAKALIVAIPDFLVRKYFEERPEMVLGLIKIVLERHSLLSRQINWCIRFTHRNANEAVFRKSAIKNEGETYAYLCLSGRLRFILEADGNMVSKKGQGRYGILEKGDWFGLVALYTDRPTVHRTVICDRYAEYLALPRYIICVITSAFREAAGYQCDYLARQIHRDHEHTFLDTDKMADSRTQISSYGAHTWRTYRMICIYPAAEFIPGKLYCDELIRHHTSCAKLVTREEALAALHYSAFNRDNEYYLAKWLVNQEDSTTILFVLAGSEYTDKWNEAVAKLCDMIQVLVTYELPHKPDDTENYLLRMAAKARKEIVFIHPVVRVTKPQVGHSKFPHLPHGSVLWLRPRSWVQRHHHVRMLDSALRYMREKNPKDLEQYLKDTKNPDKHSDYARVMRWISGQSVGIVLGGGGAKGAAQVGALHYLAELDIPVDYIAGVSIGSFLGALYAVFENILVVERKAKELWEQLRFPMRYARDFTFSPVSAGLYRGHSFNWMISYFFESIQIEDLYIPYFCVSSDLNDNCSRTHMSGDLWFYVRASMTLTLVFPPQVNQFDFHLLMDGGYSDLVPALTMRKLGIRYMIAINIGNESCMETFNIGYHVSGVKCLLQTLLPYSIDRVPNYFDFWDAVLFCSARNFIQIIKAMDEYCVYIRPNVNAYTGVDFQYYEEMRTLGYLSTKFKFGGLNLKNLPVHVIWYLLRFYTYPHVARSQAQILEGFNEDDWKFAVDLMEKTQMYQRALTTFLKMNLTPYLTDLMEARSYLENILKQEELKNIDLNVPVLENFSRDDEKLDLVHAIAKMKEWNYMEDFESFITKVKGKERKDVDMKIKTKVHAAASEIHDLINARGREAGGSVPVFDVSKMLDEQEMTNSRSIKDLYQADPTLFQAVVSYHHLRQSKRRAERDDGELYTDHGMKQKASEVPFRISRTSKRAHRRSLPSLHSIIVGFAKKSTPAPFLLSTGQPTNEGQRLEDFRMCKTRADRRKYSMAKGETKFSPIVTLKELRRSFASRGMTQL